MSAAKVAAAKKAIDILVEEYSKIPNAKNLIVGIGSGSTVAEFVPLLAELTNSTDIIALQHIDCVPTSFQSQQLIIEHGAVEGRRVLRLASLNESAQVDWVVDGADEVHVKDESIFMLKGGGGAMLQEKIVAEAAKRRIYMVDESKMSNEGLGQRRFPIPIEVVPSALSSVQRQIKLRYGKDVSVEIRQAGKAKAGPAITDNGNLILDLQMSGVFDAAEINSWLNGISGIVEHGIFIQDLDHLVIGYSTGNSTHLSS